MPLRGSKENHMIARARLHGRLPPRTALLGRTDLHAAIGDWPLAASTPLIGGHEGVGIVVGIGLNTSHCPVQLGDRVGIKWLADSGFTPDGTFSQYVVSYANHVTPMPYGFDRNAAASILCAGVTTYRAIKHSNTSAGDWIVIPGASGGLGHLAVQYAKTRNLRVIAIDTGAAKNLCLSLGRGVDRLRGVQAKADADGRPSQDVGKEIKGLTGGEGAPAAVVTATTGAGYQQAMAFLRPGGNLMAVGLPGSATLDTSIFFWLDIAARGHVKCHFELKTLADLESTYEGMHNGTVAGRFVLDMTK
ncbi:hypothetical protein DFH09DRAFT_1248425 [Mycena vulgaris]|nr:hypothetical protein DFH09DRAFT_1248425 [Mycena vulgaris]